MIHVDRDRVPRPDVLSDAPDSPASRERALAEKFFRSSRTRKTQRRFSFKVYRDPAVAAALGELFYNKCAYCESLMGHTVPLDVEQFRPKGGVTENPEHPGYWWLAATWENLLTSCPDCNRVRNHEGVHAGKANRFPLADESKRAFSPKAKLDEQPLLLDPCADFPEAELIFDEDGTVASETKRGQTTIAVLALNRKGLVEARSRAAAEVRFLLKMENQLRAVEAPHIEAELGQELAKLVRQLRSLTDASQPYAALKRQLLKPYVEQMTSEAAVGVDEARWKDFAPTITKAHRKKIKASFRAFEVAQSDFSLNDEAGREKFRSERRQIEHVSITDFKGIESLDLDIESTSGRTGWLMLLGENGTGKSSVLQAIALTLAGADYLAKLTVARGLEIKDLVRIGASQAVVSVKLSGFTGPHQLTLTARRATYRKPNGDIAHVQFTKGKASVKTGKKRSAETQSVVLGYGATRLLPRRKSTRYGIEYSRVDNLFDPFLPLYDAEQWLMRLDDSTFTDLGIVVKDLLALETDAELLRDKGCVLLQEHGEPVPLSRASDGYQAVVALGVDILEVAKRLWPRLQDAEGIVLLDEIGAHSHPAWKMRIVDSLRRAFPGMQFIATTHDPLCLRGLGEGEVVVMQRDEHKKIEAISGLPSPSDFRVDQLLTSEFFGLNSTIDPEVEKVFSEYYALLAMADRTPEQTTRLDTLRVDLMDRRYMGITLREQLMYEAVDRLVAQQKHGERRSMPQLKTEAVTEIARLWQAPA